VGNGAGVPGGGTGNLAQDAVSAALAYRAQAPVLDGLLKELGLDGSSLGGLVKGAAIAETSPETVTNEKDASSETLDLDAADVLGTNGGKHDGGGGLEG
jgi:hypothetical protein